MKVLKRFFRASPYKSIASSRLYLNIRKKFIVAYVLFILLPFLLFSFILYQQSVYTSITRDVKEASLSLHHRLDVIRSYMELLAGNTSFSSYLEAICLQNRTDAIDEQQPQIVSQIFKIANSHQIEICTIHFLYENQVHTIYTQYPLAPGQYDFFPGKRYQELIGHPDPVAISSTDTRIYGDGKFNYVVPAAAKVYLPHNEESPGILLIDFNYSILDSISENKEHFNYPDSNLLVVDEQNTVIYSTNQDLLTSSLSDNLTGNLNHASTGTFLTEINNEKSYVVFYTCPGTPWKTMNVIPFYDVLTYNIQKKSVLLTTMMVCFLILLLFPFAISSIFLKPIKKLTAAVAYYEQGNHSVEGEGTLQTENTSENLENTQSISTIDTLISKVYFTKLKQKEAELRSLQSKINPHFLYNTLESIRGAALHHEIPSIALMAKSLSQLFRYSINDNTLVPLKEEIANLNNYITIQNFRHEDKFEIIYNIPDKLYDYKILKLTLQPLVENAIKHGLEMKLGKGTIKINALDLGNIMVLEVCDDGIGMNPEKMEQLNQSLKKGLCLKSESPHSGSGIGVQNVASRIKLYFGEQYGLRFRRSEVGTTIELLVPIIK